MPGRSNIFRSACCAVLLLVAAGWFSSCAITGNLGSNYGTIRPVGTKLDCGDFRVDSFEGYLRSSPKAFGRDSYVGYEDYGPGMPRGRVFLIFPLVGTEENDLAEALVASDPKKRNFWRSGRTVRGSLAEKSFVFLVPADWSGSERMKIIHLPSLVLQGSVLHRFSKTFLVLTQEEVDPPVYDAGRLEKAHEAFLKAIQFSGP